VLSIACTTAVLSLVTASAALAADPPASASWHGRPIQAPLTQADSVIMPASFPAGWSAGAVRFGTGLSRPGGSERVREVQQRLWKLGFQPGPVDGKFGPATRAAVQWFQIKHGFKPNGVVDLRTLALLQQRTGVSPDTSREPGRGARPAEGGHTPQPQPAGQPAERGSQRPAGEHGGTSAPLGLIAVALLLLAAPLAFGAMRRRQAEPRQKAPKQRRPVALTREQAHGPTPQTDPVRPPERPIAIGYMRDSRDRAALARHARTIRQACSSCGWKLGELVRDDQASTGGAVTRPGLASAMERLSGPGESLLVVSKLAHLSRSAVELTSLFEWFAGHDVGVIAADAGIDTTTPEGREAAKVLLTKVARRQAHAVANGSNGSHHSNGSSNGKPKRDLAGAAANGKGEHG
jgi:peptidoglycan hydrolase-like protein with peptidoglycan-binding domain